MPSDKSPMGAQNNDDLFDGMFDLGGDGKTDTLEHVAAGRGVDEMMKEEEREESEDTDDYSEDGYDALTGDSVGEDPDERGSTYPGSPGNRAPEKNPGQPAAPRPVTKEPAPVPDHITYEEYEKERQGLGIIVLVWTAAFILLSAFPALFIYAGLKTLDESDSTSVLVSGGFVVISSLIILGLLRFFAFDKKIGAVNEFRRFLAKKRLFLKTASQEDRKRRRKALLIRWTVFLTLVSVIVICTVGVPAVISAVEMKKTASVYETAEAYIAEEKYYEARDTLNRIKDKGYRDTGSLINLCTAHLFYDSNEFYSANYTLYGVEFHYQSREQMARIDAFRSKLQKEIDLQNAQREAERREQERIEYEKKVRHGVPFVGMKEKDIGRTTLGVPEKRETGRSIITNEGTFPVIEYLFYNAGQHIFTAECVNGKVDYVKDLRNPSGETGKKNSGKKKVYIFEPEVEGFSHPEDFYEYYYDDFYDYEEAEDYYYSHGGR